MTFAQGKTNELAKHINEDLVFQSGQLRSHIESAQESIAKEDYPRAASEIGIAYGMIQAISELTDTFLYDEELFDETITALVDYSQND